MSTYDEYFEQIRQDNLARAEERKRQREAATAKSIASAEQTIDDAAKVTTDMYRERIDDADLLYREQYADNAINEAFTRKQIKNAMAASGMTDSGQNLTMQTAVALQRGNQDAAVTENKRNYVQQMMDAIDTVNAEAEAQKQQQRLNAESADAQWWDSILADIDTSSSEAAASMYAADQEAAAARDKTAAEYITAMQKAASETDTRREEYALNLMKNMGYSEEQAWASAYARYPSGENSGTQQSGTAVSMNEKEAALRRASDVIAGNNVLGGALGGWDWWQNRFFRTDYGEASQTVKEVTKQLETMPAYSGASDMEKEYMVAIAVANSLSASRGTKSEKNALLPQLQKVLSEDQYKVVVEWYETED